MTDGANDDPGSISLDRLVRELKPARSPKRPVRIIGIGISDDADYPALKRIAEATGGQAYSAEPPRTSSASSRRRSRRARGRASSALAVSVRAG